MRFPSLRRACAALLLTGLVTAPLGAQVVTAAPRTLGVAQTNASYGTGAGAALLNPAGLALPGRDGFSIALPAATLSAGTSPITVTDLKPYEGILVPTEVKEAWLDRIQAAGGLRADLAADVSPVGLTLGRFAFSTGTIVRGTLTLPPDAAEVLLFGNATRTGTPRDLSFDGGHGAFWAASVGALSYGMPLPFHFRAKRDDRLAVGVTGKLVAVHGLGEIVGTTGALRTTGGLETELRVPAIVFRDSTDGPVLAQGLGWDVALAYRSPRWGASVTMHDLANSVVIDPATARLYDGGLFASADSSASQSTEYRIDDPDVDPALRARAEAMAADARFQPALRVAGHVTLTSALTLSGNLLTPTGGANPLTVSTGRELGVGAEYRLFRFLPLRAGMTKLEEGSAWTVGAGLHLLGLVTIDAAYGARRIHDSASDLLSIGVTLF